MRGELIPKDEPMLIPMELPRRLGLEVDWLRFDMDMPATLKGEPLYWTGCECEC